MEKKVRPITVSVNIQASPGAVWECWTTPDHIMEWNFASDDWHCPQAENDLREGGTFSYTMASKDGETAFDFAGVYEGITLHQWISFTLEDGRQVEVVFEQNGEGTLVTETFEPAGGNPAEIERQGWQSILDNFKYYVESLHQ